MPFKVMQQDQSVMQMQLTEMLYHASPRYRTLYNSHFVQVKEYYVCSIIAVPSHLRRSASGFVACVAFCATCIPASAHSGTRGRVGAKGRRSEVMWEVCERGEKRRIFFIFMRRKYK